MSALYFVSLRRRVLRDALATLRPFEVVVLFTLVVRADPRTGRAWYHPLRLAGDLDATPGALTDAVDQLVSHGLVELLPPSSSWGVSIELGLLVHRPSDPPENLPVLPLDPV